MYQTLTPCPLNFFMAYCSCGNVKLPLSYIHVNLCSATTYLTSLNEECAIWDMVRTTNILLNVTSPLAIQN